MPIAKDNERLQITLKKELVEKMDKQRKAAGLSRSAYISNLIGQAIATEDLVPENVLKFFTEAEPETIKEFARALLAESE